MAAVWSMDQVTVPTLHCSQPMGNILRPSERRVLESNSSSVVLSTFLIFFVLALCSLPSSKRTMKKVLFSKRLTPTCIVKANFLFSALISKTVGRYVHSTMRLTRSKAGIRVKLLHIIRRVSGKMLDNLNCAF